MCGVAEGLRSNNVEAHMYAQMVIHDASIHHLGHQEEYLKRGVRVVPPMSFKFCTI